MLLTVGFAQAVDQDADLTKKLRLIMGEIERIKPGMTRAELLKFFTTEGGISTRKQQRYVDRRCPYIKVDVQFQPVGDVAADDIISRISQPFLQRMIAD